MYVVMYPKKRDWTGHSCVVIKYIVTSPFLYDVDMYWSREHLKALKSAIWLRCGQVLGSGARDHRLTIFSSVVM